MPVHVFLQKTPTIVADIDYTKSHLVPAPDEDAAWATLRRETGPPGDEQNRDGLRNDAGTAYNVQYLGTVEELAGDGVAELTHRFDPEEVARVEDLPNGGDS